MAPDAAEAVPVSSEDAADVSEEGGAVAVWEAVHLAEAEVEAGEENTPRKPQAPRQ